jgi:hypothetical protein
MAGGGLTLPLGNDPILDADRLAGQPVRPSRYVADRPYTRNVCLEIRVDGDAAVDHDAGMLGERRLGSHADADDDKVGVPVPDRWRVAQRPGVGEEAWRQ